MSRDWLIAPSILSADFGRLGEEVSAVTEAGADWIHVDVMDGHFVPVITLGPAIVKAARRATDIPLDVHLMIEDPEKHIEAFRDAGADRITVHAEACPHLHHVVHQIKKLGCAAGVALNPGTPMGVVEELLPDLDQILVMTVNPGWGGQSMIERCLVKLSQLRARVDARGLDCLLQVDGGVKVDNVGLFRHADSLVSGSGIFKSDDYAATIAGLRAGLEAAG